MALYTRILIAVDDSDNSKIVAQYGLNMASQLDAKCALVHVIDTNKISDNKYSEHLPYELLTKLKEAAVSTLDTISNQHPQLDFERFMPEGKPSKEIINIAHEWNADLIVIATRGNSGIKRMFLGSTAENTIRHSSIPVLVVPPKS